MEEKVTTLETNNEELKEFKETKEKEEILENFEEETAIFSDELKEEIKEEIETFKENPTAETAEAIINSLNAKFVKNSLAAKEKADKEKKEAEIRANSLFTSVNTFENEETNDEIKVWED